MATPGQLVRTMADVLGIPRATVAQYDRQLAEAGLRTVGGRGTSAAKVTAGDAANLLIAILGSPVSGPSIKAAKQTCETFGSLPTLFDSSDARKFREFGLLSLAKLSKIHTFCDALAALIQGASRGELFRIIDGDDVLLEADFWFVVTVESRHPWAEIICGGSAADPDFGRLIYSFPEQVLRAPSLNERDLGQSRRITFRTLRLLGNLIGSGRG